jgi:hypothetical protein
MAECEQLTAPEFLNLLIPVKYGHTWTLQGRERKFFSAPTTWQSNPRFEKSFFFVSGLGWELPPILWDRPPEARVPRNWGDPKSKRVFPKPKLTAAQQDRLDRMVAWSTVSMEAEGEESNLGFLLRPANLQKYLGFSERRCAGMAHIPDVLFPSKKKVKVEGSTRRTRSKGPSLAPVKDVEPSASSDEGSVSLSLSSEGGSAGEGAPQIVEGLIVLDDSPGEDEDDVPLVARTRILKRKVAEPPEDADPSPSPKEGGMGSHEYAEFIRMYPPTKKARGVNVLFVDEGSGPSTEAVPLVGGEGEIVTLPSFPPLTSEVELTIDEVGTDPATALEEFASEAIIAEAGLISEIEDVVAAADREEIAPITTGATSMTETVPFEVRDLPEVQNEPELMDLRVPHQEGIEPVDVDVSLSTEVTAPEVRDHSKVHSEPELPGPGVEEVASSGGLAWWEAIGSQGDPVLGLRHQIEVCRTVVIVRLVLLKFGLPIDFVHLFFFFFRVL